MSVVAPELVYAVFIDDPPQGSEVRAGAVGLDREGRMRLVHAEAGHALRLQEVVRLMNAKTLLHPDASPAPDAPRTATVQPVMRGDPAFNTALLEHLGRYYGLNLA